MGDRGQKCASSVTRPEADLERVKEGNVGGEDARNRLLSLSLSFFLSFDAGESSRFSGRGCHVWQVDPGRREHNKIHNARWNFSRLPLMPHRPLFVSQCHHFSPVIYFIAISVSLPPPPPLHRLLFFFTCSHLSLSLSLSPALTVCPRTPSRSKLSTEPHNTQFRSPHPLPEALLYASISVSRSISFSFSEVELSFRFLSRSRSLAAFGRLCRMRERERRKIERGRKNDRERMRERERGKENADRETTLARARRARRGERYNCI